MLQNNNINGSTQESSSFSMFNILNKQLRLVISAFLLLIQIAIPITDLVAYAAASPIAQVSSSASLDPVSNKASRLQSQGTSGVDQSTGALTYSYPINLPAGRNSMSPSLALSYNSQNNDSGWFGYGWTMSIPYVERVNKTGSDKLYTDKNFISSLHGELNSNDGTNYQQKTDDGSYAKYILLQNSWQMIDRDGNVYYFGNSDSSRIQNTDGSKAGRWYLTSVIDKFGNGVTYNYTKNLDTVYPLSISYTEHAMAHPLNLVTFNLEDKADALTSYKYGFKTIDAKRISYIKVATNGKDNAYISFNYTSGSNNVRSLLSSIEEKRLGTTGDWITTPKTLFEYEKSAMAFSGTIQNTEYPYESKTVIDTNNDGILDLYDAGPEYFPIDINGDFKKDLLQSDQNYGAYQGVSIVNYRYNRGTTPFDLINRKNSSINYLTTLPMGWPAPLMRSQGEYEWWWTTQGSVADINGDGFEDVLYSDRYVGNGVGLNTKNNTFSYPSSYNFSIDINNEQVSDINADGLLDKISKSYTATSTLFNVYLNNGSGYNASSSFIYDAKVASTTYDIGVRFSDVNNDGLIDVVRSYKSVYGDVPPCNSFYSVPPSNQRPPMQTVNEIYTNTGNSFSMSSSTLVGYISYYSGCPSMYAYNITANGTKEFDTNGDLTTDYDGSINNTKKQDVLKNVTTSLGSSLDISYKWSTATGLNSKLSIPTYIVDSTTEKRNITDSTPHIVNYVFSNGNTYFDETKPIDHRFAGFGNVDVIDGNLKTTTYYHQGDGDNYVSGEKGDSFYNIGRPYRTDVIDISSSTNPVLLSKSLSLYKTYATASSSFTYLDTQVSNSYNSDGSFVSVASKQTYDETKRLIKTSIDYGDVEPFVSFASSTILDKGIDTNSTEFQYSNSRPQRLVRKTVTDYSGNLLDLTSYYFDNLPFGLVDRGAQTSIVTKVYKGDGSLSTTATSTLSYDMTGNVTQSVDAVGKITKIVYDNNYFFPKQKIDALGATTTFTYDPYTLNLLTTKTPDNITRGQEVDGLGNVIRSYSLNSSLGVVSDTYNNYVYGNGLVIFTIKLQDANNKSRSSQSYDSFGRLVQTKVEVSPDLFSTKNTHYDAKGNVVATSLPYNSTSYSNPNDISPNGQILYTYDAAGRVLTKIVAGQTISYTYNNRSISIQDNASTQHKKSYTYDARNNLSQVTEYNNSIPYITKYSYTPMNKLSSITDANGNIRNFSYLTDGNLTYIEDPHPVEDTTFTTYKLSYDAMGRLTKKTGPLGSISYTYDVLHRPLTLVSYDATNGTSTVSLTYNNCANTYDAPCLINRDTSSTTLSYGYDGNLSSESLVIDGKTFVRSYQYNNLGQPVAITYPDGGVANYTYSLDGKQTKLSYTNASGTVKEIVKNTEFDSFGNLTNLVYGNGVQLCNSYTSTSTDGAILPRLAKSQYLFNVVGCSTVEPNSVSLYKDEFSYKDSMNPSNILSTYKDISGSNHTKNDSFTYDNLARLTQVVSSYESAASTTSTLSYDPIGNILKENDVLYSYSKDGMQNAHAATGIGSTRIDYDGQGNRIKMGDSTYSWNVLNQMTRASSTDGVETYTYDENGERIKKVVQANKIINQKVTPDTAVSKLTTYRQGDLFSVSTSSTTYVASSTYNKLNTLSLLSSSTIKTMVASYYGSAFTTSYCATATSTALEQACVASTTKHLVANDIFNRSTSTVITKGFVDDLVFIAQGLYQIPVSTSTYATTTNVALSDNTTFTISSALISSYNTYITTGVIVPVIQYEGMPLVSTTTYQVLSNLRIADIAKIKALFILAGCSASATATPCTLPQKIIFENFYKNNGTLVSDKVLYDIWLIYAGKVRVPANSNEYTATSTIFASTTVPTLTGRTTTTSTSTYYGSSYATYYNTRVAAEPRLVYWNTIPPYVTKSSFLEYQAAGITQTTLENYVVLIRDLLNISTASSSEYILALKQFVKYDKAVTTLSDQALKELYMTMLGAETIPNNVDDYIANATFDLSSYLSIETAYGAYQSTFPYTTTGCKGGYSSSYFNRCIIKTNPFTIPVASSSIISYLLSVTSPGPNDFILNAGESNNPRSVVDNYNYQTQIPGIYSSRYAPAIQIVTTSYLDYISGVISSDGSTQTIDVTPTVIKQQASSTDSAVILLMNRSGWTNGLQYPYESKTVTLKAVTNTPRDVISTSTINSLATSTMATSSSASIQTKIAQYFGEIYDSSDPIENTISTSTITFISIQAAAEFASTTLTSQDDISKIFSSTSTPWCVANASTTECDKQARISQFRQVVGNLSGFIPSVAATEEFWMVYKNILQITSATSTPGNFPAFTITGCGDLYNNNVVPYTVSVLYDSNDKPYQTNPCSGQTTIHFGGQTLNVAKYLWLVSETTDLGEHFWNGTYTASRTKQMEAYEGYSSPYNTFTVDGHTITAVRADNTVNCQVGTCTSFTDWGTYNGNNSAPGKRFYGFITTSSSTLDINSSSTMYANLASTYIYQNATGTITFLRSSLPQTLSTSTATTSINLSLVPPGLLSDTQFRSVYATSTFALATTTRTVSQDTYNELLYTPLRENSDIKNIFNYYLSYATSTCSGQGATSTCVMNAQKTKVKDLISSISGFIFSDAALEELYRVYTNAISIIPISLIDAVTTESTENVTLAMDLQKSLRSVETTSATTTETVGVCYFGKITSASSTSKCDISIPDINSPITNLKVSYTFASSTPSKNSLLSTLVYLTPNSTSSESTSTITFATTTSTSTVAGVKDWTNYTFDITDIYQTYLNSYKATLSLSPISTLSTLIYTVGSPKLIVTRKVSTPRVTYDTLTSMIAFDRASISSFATSTATSTITQVVPADLDLSMVYVSPIDMKLVYASSSIAVPTTSLQAYYKMDGNSNDLISSNNGTDTSVTYSTSTGKINAGANFNGTSSVIQLPDISGSYISANNFTLNTWIKTPTVGTGNQTIFGKDAYGTSRVFNTRVMGTTDGTPGKVQFQRFDASQNVLTNLVSSGRIDDNNWHMVSFVFDSTSGQKIYIDGVINATDTVMTANNTAAGVSLYLGKSAYQVSNLEYLNGSLDEASIWSRTLSSTEIAGLYANGTGKQYPFAAVAATSTAPVVYAKNQGSSNTNTLLDVEYTPANPYTPAGLPPITYPYATSVATTSLNSLSVSTTTTYTVYSPFTNYTEDSRSIITTSFTLNGQLVGSYSYSKLSGPSSGKLTFTHSNYLGTPSLETDDKGDIIQLDITDTFGNYVQRDHRVDNALHVQSYTGHEYDDVTRLIYAHARYLDTSAHTFLSVDPMLYKLPQSYLMDPQQMNSYSYARGNPIIYTDPTGLFNIKNGAIEKGDTLSSITDILNKTFNMAMDVGQIAKTNNIKNPNKILAGDSIILPNRSNLELRFDNKNLQAFDKTYNSGFSDLKWGGMSGSANRGYSPIPEGTWKTVDSTEIQYWNDLSFSNKVGSTLSAVLQLARNKKTGSFPGGTYSWGTQRTELLNSTDNVRSGYYIHGGSANSPDSAGCIDLNMGNDSFHEFFRSYGKPLDLIVKY